MKYISFLFCILLFCAPQKESVSEVDSKRVIERLAAIRISESLDFDSSTGKSPRTDVEIFLDVCKILRLKPELVLEKIKLTDIKLYKHLAN